jgi:hypothetical protein
MTAITRCARWAHEARPTFWRPSARAAAPRRPRLHAGLAILSQREGAGLAHAQQPRRAVSTHAGEDEPNGVATDVLSHGVEEHIDRRPVAVDRSVVTHHAKAFEPLRSTRRCLPPGATKTWPVKSGAPSRASRTTSWVSWSSRAAKRAEKTSGMCCAITMPGMSGGNPIKNCAMASVPPVDPPIAMTRSVVCNDATLGPPRSRRASPRARRPRGARWRQWFEAWSAGLRPGPPAFEEES